MTKEEIFDAEIAPLMTQIMERCTQHNISMVGSFQIADVPEALLCSYVFFPPEATVVTTQSLMHMAAVIYPEKFAAVMIPEAKASA